MIRAMPDPDDPGSLHTDWLPSGPALLYIPSDPGGLVTESLLPTAFRVDTHRITGGGPLSDDGARRERMLLRALLSQALWLLGPEEDEG